MKKIFTDKKLNIDDIFSLDKELYNHVVNALRSKINDSFILGDIDNNEFIGKIIEIKKNICNIQIIENYIRNIKQKKLTLYFPLLKKDNTEFILEKCTELGITDFIPYTSKNSVCKPDNIENKLLRWKTIVKESSQQSLRELVPNIYNPIRIQEIEKTTQNTIGLISHIDGLSIMNYKDIIKNNHIIMIVGPEGDFTDEEIKDLKNKGFISCKISENILRSETSCISIVATVSLLID